jgi:hypothetical protein
MASPIVFRINEKALFQDTAKAHALIVGNIFLKDLNYKEVKVERLSFINYAEQTFYPNFPFNQPIVIHNTGSDNQFGFGNFAAKFFEVIATIDDNKPTNFRIFYELLAPKTTLVEALADPEVRNQIDNKTKESSEQQDVSSANESVDAKEPTDTIFILGENRPLIKKGRSTYVMYDGKQISLTEAKKLEKTKK